MSAVGEDLEGVRATETLLGTTSAGRKLPDQHEEMHTVAVRGSLAVKEFFSWLQLTPHWSAHRYRGAAPSKFKPITKTEEHVPGEKAHAVGCSATFA